MSEYLDYPQREGPTETPRLAIAKELALEAAQAVATETGIPLEDILGERRWRPWVAARHEAWLRVREVRLRDGKRFSFPTIGKAFGVDHTTVMNGCRRALECRQERRA